MTKESFLAFYPAFTDLFPDAVLTEYITQSNARFSDFEEDTEEARRLFTAHKLTLYAKVVPTPSGEGATEITLSDLTSAGEGTRVTSRRVENVSATYAYGGASSGSASSLQSELSETLYGIQLLALLKLHAHPRYVP